MLVNTLGELQSFKMFGAFRAVPMSSRHKINQGGVPVKYDKTIKIGNTTIHIVAPPPQTEEEIDRILDEYHKAGWAIVREMQEKAAKKGGENDGK